MKKPGKPMMWEDRGQLTPAQIFLGPAGTTSNPEARLPAPPFTNCVPDRTKNAYSPKAYCTDKNGTKWTAKFGSEVHADTTAPRLAWALGYAIDEGYFVPSGKFENLTKTGSAKCWADIHSDGSFQNARFKRHPEHHLADAKGVDLVWDEAVNPGVPQEQLSGLKIMDVMVCNWDAQAKNCKVLRIKGENGPEDWYIMSDWGESFGPPKGAWKLKSYTSYPFIKSVSANGVQFNFYDTIPKEARDHQHVSLQDAQWFRARLATLTDDDIIAAFNAAYTNDAISQAYASGDMARVNALTPPTVKAFAAAFRRRVNEFEAKVPAGP